MTSRGSDPAARAPRSESVPGAVVVPAAAGGAIGHWLDRLSFPLLLLLTGLAYLPVWHAGYVWDDDAHKIRAALQSLDGLRRIWTEPGATQQYYPVLYSAFWIEHRLWGEAALGYHLLNVGLHATAAWLLFRLLRRLGIPGALLAATVFAVHPVCVESVAWISEQKNTLSTVFYLAAALLFLRFDERRHLGWYAASLACFVLALLSKTVTATLPAALLVLIWWKRGTLRWRSDVLPLLPWVVVGAGAGLFTAWVERTHVGASGTAFSLSLADRVLVAGRAVWFYAAKLVWPANLTFIYPRWAVNSRELWQWAFPAATAVVIAACLAIRTRHRTPLAVILLFVGTLSPALGFVSVFPFLYSYVADHFQYLAVPVLISACTAMGAIWMRQLSVGARTALTVVAVGLVGGLAVLTARQCAQYADSETLWRTTIARNPGCWMAYNNLGGDLLEAGRLEEAFPMIREGLRLAPQNAAGHTNLGNVLWQQGQRSEAMEQYRQALAVDSTHVPAHLNLGNALLQTGHLADAIAEYRRVLELKPEFGRAHANLGAAYARAGQLDQAVAEYRQAVQQDSHDAGAHTGLGAALARRNQTDAAIAEFKAALKIEPGSAAARANLARALLQTGRIDGALEEYRRLVAIAPPYPKAHTLLADALAGTGRLNEATDEYEAALVADPADAEAHANLGTLRARQGSIDEAVTHFRRAVEIRPDFVIAHANLARSLLALGRYAEAAAEFQRVLELAPSSADAQRGLEMALAGASTGDAPSPAARPENRQSR